MLSAWNISPAGADVQLAPWVQGWDGMIVVLSAVLFGTSTAISWGWNGDRYAACLFGAWAILPYRLVYVGMVFLGTRIPPPPPGTWETSPLAS